MYKKVLVPLDGSELAECVFPHLETIAQGCGVGEVDLVRMVEEVTLPVGTISDGISIITTEDAEKMRKAAEARAKAEAEEYLGQVKGRIKLGSAGVNTQVIVGPAAESLADYATKNGVDLIVIATHGRSGVSRWVWGSVSDRILRSACVPILMVRAPGCVAGI